MEQNANIDKNKPKKKVFVSFIAWAIIVIIGGFAIGLGFSAGNFILPKIAEGQPLSAVFANTAAPNDGNAEPETDSTEDSDAIAALSFGSFGTFSVSEAFNIAKNYVVSINVVVQKTDFFNRVQTGLSAGSGVVFKEDADYIYIATNYHVIDRASKCAISFDDVTQVEANFVGGYPNADIAVIKTSKSNLKKAGITDYKIAVFANSSTVQVGDMVIAVGNANGGGKSATFGIVSITERPFTDDGGQTLSFLQTDAAINPGNSGGALVNTNGEVVGINTAKLVSSEIEGIGYAIPSNNALSLLEQIMASSSYDNVKPMLGVLTVDVTQSEKEQYGFPTIGVYVYSVTQGSAAETMDIRVGDIITSFNGETVITGTQLSDDIAKSKVGEEVTVTIVRFSQSRFGVISYQTLVLKGTMYAAVSGTNF